MKYRDSKWMETPMGRVVLRPDGTIPAARLFPNERVLSALEEVDKQTQIGRKQSVIEKTFGRDVVTFLRNESLITGTPTADPVLSVTLKGREAFGKVPSNVKRLFKRNREFFSAFEETTNKTFKPSGTVGKGINKGRRFFIEVQHPVSEFGRRSRDSQLFASLDDAIAGKQLRGLGETK